MLWCHPQTKQTRVMTSQTKLCGNHGNTIPTGRILQDFCKLSEKLHALLVIKYSLIRMIKSGNVRRAEYGVMHGWDRRLLDYLGEQDTDGRHLKQGGKAWNGFMWPRMGDFWMVLVNQVLNLTENLTNLTKNNLWFLLVASCNRYRVSKHEIQHETSRTNETKNIKDTDISMSFVPRLIRTGDAAAWLGIWMCRVCQQMRNDVNGHFISYSLNQDDVSSKIKTSHGVQKFLFQCG